MKTLRYYFSTLHLLPLFLCLAVLYSWSSPGWTAESTRLSQQPMMHKFIKQMVAKHGFDRKELERIFDKVVVDKTALKKETKEHYSPPPWFQYRKYFLTEKRINRGVLYWREHAKTLARAAKVYGVQPNIIVAILGIETLYGKHMGKHKALDALTTLAFKYPQRAHYFLGELESFLLLTRQSKTDPDAVLGSFAGALGQAQFMPTSYLMYSVDFSGDGYADLFTNPQDVIGSIANFFHQHGWKRAQPILVRATVIGDKYKKVAIKDMRKLHEPAETLKQLAKFGIKPKGHYPQMMLATFMIQQGDKGEEYWLGFHNFYVITRYNNQAMYALAVYELGQAIKERYQQLVKKKR